MIKIKKCLTCNKEKDLSEFYKSSKHSKSKGKYTYYLANCKMCLSLKSKSQKIKKQQAKLQEVQRKSALNDEFVLGEPHNPRIKPVTYKINENGCWICTSHSQDKDGYFLVRRRVNKIKFNRMHRYTYYLKNKEIDNLLILHSCNNPSCINPEHLRKGTHEDNMQDRLESGHYYNEYSSYAKLTENEVIKIKKLLSEEIEDKVIAKMFQVSHYCIGDIRRGRTWERIEI